MPGTAAEQSANGGLHSAAPRDAGRTASLQPIKPSSMASDRASVAATRVDGAPNAGSATLRVSVDEPYYLPGSRFSASVVIRYSNPELISLDSSLSSSDSGVPTEGVPTLQLSGDSISIPNEGSGNATPSFPILGDAAMKLEARRPEISPVWIAPREVPTPKTPLQGSNQRLSLSISVANAAPGSALLSARTPSLVFGGSNTGVNSQSKGAERTRHVLKVEMVAAEILGRWGADRAWIAPNGHGSFDRNAVLSSGGMNGSRESGINSPMRAPLGGDNLDGKSPAWREALDDIALTGKEGDPYCGFIFRSQPHVIATRETVGLGSQVSFRVHCLLPNSIPPTFRGVAMRYTYSLSLVVVLNGGLPKTLRVPFRVLVPGMHDASGSPQLKMIPVPLALPAFRVPNLLLESTHPSPLQLVSQPLNFAGDHENLQEMIAVSLNGRLSAYRTDAELWKNNLLDDSQSSIAAELEAEMRARRSSVLPRKSSGGDGESEVASQKSGNVAGQIGQGLSAPMPPAGELAPPRSSPVYRISFGSKLLVLIHLVDRMHRLGDTLGAVLDYSQASWPCHKVEARLEVQEVLLPKKARGSKEGRAVSGEGVMFRRTYGEFVEKALNCESTHFLCGIPHDAPVSFSTDVVAVRWFMHFKFWTPSEATVAALVRQGAATGNEGVHSLGAASQDILPGVERLFVEDQHFQEQNMEVLSWSLPIHVSAGNRDSFLTVPCTSIKLS
ncbi:hypothetical protein FVE85_2189 [Porphyridium purpureum]|uniref:RAB6A-GEF complex partner protein 2 n=1 Tax=Porphyridium purpureum TaxID=35688 RepID=A0A5J4YZ73_PORPP|nr:hypothetical protein FVE85_2189 [Porphyridium purpureum]|eukprot:POR7089..scf209_3